MKIITLRRYMNTIILVTILLLNALYHSEIGGPGTIFNKIGFLLAFLFLYLNFRFNPFLSLAFAVPLLFLFSSVMINATSLHAGGFNSALATATGYALMTLKPPPLDNTLMKRLILIYLIAALILSLHSYLELLSTGNIIGLVANTNFNINPNAASLFFFSCLALSLAFVSGWLKWIFVTAFSVLVLTTGSRAGFSSTAILITGFTFFGSTNNSRLFNWKALLSKKTLQKILLRIFILATIVVSVITVLPDSFTFLQQRFSNSGFGLAAAKGGGGRDELWKDAFEVSLRSPKTVVFGNGPATASDMIGSGTHSSYVEAITSVGWPFLIFTLFAVFCLFSYHKRHMQKDFLLVGITILIYGASSTELFNGMGSIWWIFILLSLYYRSIGNSMVSLGKLGIRE